MSLFGRMGTPNTGAAAPSLFSPSPQQTPGGLFGAPAAQTPAGTGSLFGASNNAQSTPAQGLFGAAPTSTPAPTSGNMFGGTPAATTSAPASGGLFGGTPAATSAPASGGLFGGAANTGGGGLFGGGGAATGTSAATTTPSLNTPATGGLFGGGANSAAPASGGLFGGATSNVQQQQRPTLSLNQPAANTGGGGLFGAPSSTPQTQPNTGGLFGPSTQTTGASQTNTVPAATIDVSKLTPTTRFGDCHESVQRELEMLDKHIHEQIKISSGLSTQFPSHRSTIESIPADASVLTHKLATTKSFLTTDQAALNRAQESHKIDDEASTLSIRTLDLFRLPHAQRSQYISRSVNNSGYATNRRGGGGTDNNNNTNDVTSNGPMIKYFNSQVDEMEKKMHYFWEAVHEVAASLKSIEEQAAAGGRTAGVNEDTSALAGGIPGRQDARRLNRALRGFNDALKDVSGRIVDARDAVRELKEGGGRR